MSRLFLGLDSSTQSLTAIVIDLDAGRVVFDLSLNYDRHLPDYKTQDGVLRRDEGAEVHAPPLMWAEALELIFERMRAGGIPMDEIAAVSGSGQQHGSVYLTREAANCLAHLDPGKPLAPQLASILSRPTSPVWMDSSTTRECREISDALGGEAAMAEATGSAATERFTGPQIKKYARTDPEGYARTSHIALVSSFMCSLLSGRIAPVEPGDGAGMNLMDIRRGTWHAGAVTATAPALAGKLPLIAPPCTRVGSISPYWVHRFGFSPNTASIVWSGDNPCSAIGLGLVAPGEMAISMGTSYTVMGTLDACRTDPRAEGHVFGLPAGGYMALICFKNGGLARARLRDEYGLDWAGFARAISTTPPGNQGRLMLPWFDPEIVPKILVPGVRRRNLDPQDAAANCRALVEAQMMAMKLHSAWMGIDPGVIHATGGASEDKSVLQVMADVFRRPVQPFAVTKSAALGAAIIAARAWLNHQGRPSDWSILTEALIVRDPSLQIHPDPAASDTYAALLKEYEAFERANGVV